MLHRFGLISAPCVLTAKLQAHLDPPRFHAISLMNAALVSSRTGDRNTIDPKAVDVVTYWLGAVDRKPAWFPSDKKQLWFRGGPDVDKETTDSFGDLLKQAAKTGLPDWQRHHNGLAAVLVMDQFSRNVYRGSAQTYNLDAKARIRAQQLINSGDAAKLILAERLWLAFPFMHSEKPQDQQAAVGFIKDMIKEAEYLENADDLQKFLQMQLSAADRHIQVIEQWGRFPHRNALLGRASTPEEEQGMSAGTIPRF